MGVRQQNRQTLCEPALELELQGVIAGVPARNLAALMFWNWG